MPGRPDPKPAPPLRLRQTDDLLEQAKAMRAAALLQARWGLAAYAAMLLALGLFAAILGGEYDVTRGGAPSAVAATPTGKTGEPQKNLSPY